MFRFFITTLVTLISTTSAMKLPQLSELKTAQPTASNISLFESVISQPPPDLVTRSSQHIAEPQYSSIDPLTVIMETTEISEKYNWLSKLASLGVPYDPEWKTMNSQQLQLVHSTYKAIIKMRKELSSRRFQREDSDNFNSNRQYACVDVLRDA